MFECYARRWIIDPNQELSKCFPNSWIWLGFQKIKSPKRFFEDTYFHDIKRCKVKESDFMALSQKTGCRIYYRCIDKKIPDSILIALARRKQKNQLLEMLK